VLRAEKSVPKREEVTRDWIKVHIQKLHDLYLSPNNIRVMKWRRRKCTRHRTRWANLMERDYLENLDEGVSLILKFIWNNQDGKPSIGFIWLRVGTIGRFL
jgi:hypothetical protein